MSRRAVDIWTLTCIAEATVRVARSLPAELSLGLLLRIFTLSSYSEEMIKFVIHHGTTVPVSVAFQGKPH